MNSYDLPVRVGGKVYRFVSNGTKGALFSKNAPPVPLTVIADSEPRKMPQVTGEDGAEVLLGKSARPCSCKGAPWSERASALVAQL